MNLCAAVVVRVTNWENNLWEENMLKVRKRKMNTI